MGDFQFPDYRRFTVAVKLNREERDALIRLTQQERLPAAQVVRRLIWTAAEQASCGSPVMPPAQSGRG